MRTPEGLKYTKEHEWVRMEEDLVYIGITDYAQDSLGDIVFIELPAEGDVLASGQTMGVVESVKAASDIYMPLSGKVKKVNNALLDNPESVNENPYDSWMIAIEPTDASELEALLNQDEYKKLCAKED